MKITIFMRESEKFGVSCVPYDSQFAALMNTAPQQRWSGAHEDWTLENTEPNIKFLAREISVRFSKECEITPSARVYMTKALLNERLLSVKAKRRAEYTFKDEAPVITDYDFPEDYPPYKHQIVAFDAARGEDFFAQFMEMGTGKTPVTIHDICWNAIKKIGTKDVARSPLPAAEDESEEAKLCRTTRTYRVLLIAPKSVCSNWGKELKKHSTLPFAFEVARGEMVERIKSIRKIVEAPQRLKMVAINYEGLKKMLPVLRACKFDMVVCDESTRIKSSKADRTQAAIELVTPFQGHQPKRRILSGQPITKDVRDLYTQLEFLRPGENLTGFTSFAAFCRRYAQKDTYSLRIIPRNIEELKEKVGQISMIVKKHDCLDLPPKAYTREDVEMTLDQAQFYEDMELKLFQELMAETGSSFTVSAKNTLTKLLRLAQITSGFVPADKDPEDEDRYRELKKFEPNPKLARLVELVDELVDINGPGQKVLIWACFKTDIRAIEAALADAGIASVTFFGETSDAEREVSLSQFESNDAIRVFIGQPQSGGIGLTLTGSETCPTGTAIYYSRNFSLEQRSQSEDRAHRIGMFRPLTIIDLLSVYPEEWKGGRGANAPTIDARILQRLIDKKDFAEGFTDAKSVAMSMLGVANNAQVQAQV